MDKKEIIITFDLLKDFHIKNNNTNITDEFIYYENVHYPGVEDYRFIVSRGLNISFLRKGKIDIQINTDKYSVEAPAIITVFSDFSFESYKQYPGAEIDVLFISIECIYDSHLLPNLHFLWKIITTPVYNIPEEKAALINDLKDHMMKLFKIKTNPLYDVLMKNIMYAYVMEITSTPYYLHPKRTAKDIHQREITNDFFRLLHKKRPIQRSVAFYAEELCVSTRSLYNAVKNTTGFPVMKWIHALLIFEAKKILKSTDLSIDHISEKLNFKSSAFFIYFFKRMVGTTPLNYRKL